MNHKLPALAKSYDLALVAGAAVLALLLALSGAQPRLLSLPLGLALVFVLPGYAAQVALLSGRAVETLERGIVALATSIGLAIVGGLLLNLTPWGLTRISWTLLLAALTVGLCLVGALQRRAAHGGGAQAGGRWVLRMPARQALMLGLAFGITAGAIALSYQDALQRPSPEVVQLWALQQHEAGEHALSLGIANDLSVPARYRLELRQGGALLSDWPVFEIGPGQDWQARVPVPATLSRAEPVEVLLYDAAQPSTDAMRRVIIWIKDQ